MAALLVDESNVRRLPRSSHDGRDGRNLLPVTWVRDNPKRRMRPFAIVAI
jgi:hypothetical protein